MKKLIAKFQTEQAFRLIMCLVGMIGAICGLRMSQQAPTPLSFWMLRIISCIVLACTFVILCVFASRKPKPNAPTSAK